MLRKTFAFLGFETKFKILVSIRDVGSLLNRQR